MKLPYLKYTHFVFSIACIENWSYLITILIMIRSWSLLLMPNIIWIPYLILGAKKELRYLIKWPKYDKRLKLLFKYFLLNLFWCFTLIFKLKLMIRIKTCFSRHYSLNWMFVLIDYDLFMFIAKRFCVSSNCFTLILLVIKYRARRIIMRLYCWFILVANFISRNELIDKVNHDYVNWCTYTGVNEQSPKFKWSHELYLYW